MKFNVTRFLAWCVLLMVLPMGLWAQSQLGRIKAARVTGTVYKVSPVGDLVAVTDKTEFLESDGISTGADSSVVLVFENASTVRIGPNSLLVISEFAVDPLEEDLLVDHATSEPNVSNTTLSVVYGEMVGDVRKLNSSSSYSIKTPVGAAGIRGTQFFVSVDPVSGQLRVVVASGRVEVTTDRPTTPGAAIYPTQTFMLSSGEEVQGNMFWAENFKLTAANEALMAAILENVRNITEARTNEVFPVDSALNELLKQAYDESREQERESLEKAIKDALEKQAAEDTTGGALSAEEKAKQEQIKRLEAERKAKQDTEKLKQDELKKKNEELQKKLQDQLEKLKAEKLKAEEAAKQKAAEEYAKKLTDDAAKAAFEAKQEALKPKLPPPPVVAPPQLTPPAGSSG
jgi:hypothetical protein